MYGNARNFFAWFFLVLFAILMIVAGIQGSAGRILAVALCPSKLDVQGEAVGPGMPWPFGPGIPGLPFSETVYQ